MGVLNVKAPLALIVKIVAHIVLNHHLVTGAYETHRRPADGMENSGAHHLNVV